MALSEAARALVRAGDTATARTRLAALDEIPVAGAFARIVATAAWAAALIAVDEGRHEDAVAHQVRTRANGAVALWAGADVVESAVRAGDTDSVRAWLTDAAAAAATTGSPHLALLVERTRGLLAPDDETALGHLAAAVDLGSAIDTPFDLAVARLHLGERLRRVRRIVDARQHLSEAARLFDRIGARNWAARAASELRATGGQSTDRTSTDRAPARLLTAQELLVSRMAATGRTNKEIADEVYLSHRTVAAHLSRAFTKLGISRRSQLAGALRPSDRSD
jgi:DNA-binding CsgD family transcriptional regulator